MHHRAFHFGARGDLRAGTGGGQVGQLLAVDLPGGGQRQSVQLDDAGGDHLRGKVLLHVLDDSRGSATDDVRAQQSIDDERDGVLDAGCPEEARLDLTQLDANTAHLDLAVDAPEVLEIAGG